MLKYCLDKYKTQELCDKVIQVFLSTLKFVPGWFVTNTMPEKLDNAVIFNDDIFCIDVDSNIIIFLSHDMGFDTINLNNITLDNDNFDENYPETIIHFRLMAWRKKHS